MEERKNQEEPKKLTYEELSGKFNELWQQYQKLVKMHQQAMAQLNDQSFNVMSFYLSMLFKVMDHTESYPEKFITWASENIQNMMLSLAESLAPKDEKNADAKEEKGEDK